MVSVCLSRALHCPLSQASSGSCTRAPESIWTPGCTEGRPIPKCTGDTHTYASTRYGFMHTVDKMVLLNGTTEILLFLLFLEQTRVYQRA